MVKSVLVSVIIPVYNCEDFIRESLMSICNQTYNNLEIIICDDGSTDNTLNIVKEISNIDTRIKFYSRDNRGLVYTLNELCNRATGIYIARMDADDISHIDRIKCQVSLLNSGVDICGCHFYIIDNLGKYISSRVVSTDDSFQGVILSRSTPFAHGSVMFRRKFYQDNRFNYSKDEYKTAEDYFLWTLFYQKGAVFGNVDEFLFYYRELPSSLSKINKKNNLHDAYKISDLFIKNNVLNIEKNLSKSLEKKQYINDFEQEQLSFYVFYTFFNRSVFKSIVFFKMISANNLIVGCVRAINVKFVKFVNFFK